MRKRGRSRIPGGVGIERRNALRACEERSANVSALRARERSRIPGRRALRELSGGWRCGSVRKSDCACEQRSASVGFVEKTWVVAHPRAQGVVGIERWMALRERAKERLCVRATKRKRGVR